MYYDDSPNTTYWVIPTAVTWTLSAVDSVCRGLLGLLWILTLWQGGLLLGPSSWSTVGSVLLCMVLGLVCCRLGGDVCCGLGLLWSWWWDLPWTCWSAVDLIAQRSLWWLEHWFLLCKMMIMAGGAPVLTMYGWNTGGLTIKLQHWVSQCMVGTPPPSGPSHGVLGC